MKKSPLYFLATIMLAIAIPSCNKNKYPDLDPATADQLEASAIPGVFISRVKVSTAPDTISKHLLCATACADIKKYFGYVVYPYTICTPPDFVINDEITTLAAKAKQDSLLPLLTDKHPVTHQLKSTRFAGYKNLWCRTVGGPWGAYLTDEELCGGCGPGDHKFILEIGGLPGNPAWVWFGTLANAPADAPATNNMGLNSTTVRDCNPSDLTNCGQNTGGGGPIPAAKPEDVKK